MYDVAPCGARPEPFGPADIVILPLRVGQVCVLAQGERMLLVGCGRRIEETLWGRGGFVVDPCYRVGYPSLSKSISCVSIAWAKL